MYFINKLLVVNIEYHTGMTSLPIPSAGIKPIVSFSDIL